jgi:hypothetical protein
VPGSFREGVSPVPIPTESHRIYVVWKYCREVYQEGRVTCNKAIKLISWIYIVSNFSVFIGIFDVSA